MNAGFLFRVALICTRAACWLVTFKAIQTVDCFLGRLPILGDGVHWTTIQCIRWMYRRTLKQLCRTLGVDTTPMEIAAEAAQAIPY